MKKRRGGRREEDKDRGVRKKYNLENLEKLSRREGKQNYCPVQELKRTIQEGGEAELVNFKNSENLSRREEKQNCQVCQTFNN